MIQQKATKNTQRVNNADDHCDCDDGNSTTHTNTTSNNSTRFEIFAFL